MKRTYLLTGGTGFLGSRLSLALLARGDKVVFLGRSKDGIPLHKRVRSNLAAAERTQRVRSEFEALEVNLEKPDLGVPAKTIEHLGTMGIDGIWHAAANLSFDDADRARVFSTNVLGTTNMLNLSERLQRPLYHISTAYVHGQRRGHILESDLVEPRAFNNVYEESKFEAEKLLQASSSAHGLVIFRPSILVGKATTERLSAQGYYAVLDGVYRCMLRLRQERRRKDIGLEAPLRFPLPMLYARSSRLNLMPSDVAVKLMLEIAENPASAGGTFHITNPKPFSMAEVTRQTFEALGLASTTIGAPRWITKMYLRALTRFDRLKKGFPAGFVRKLELYRNYMTQDNTYDMRNTRCIVGDGLPALFEFNGSFVRERAAEFLEALHKERTAIRLSLAARRHRSLAPIQTTAL